ncbi:hypothetical protein [Erythrobacter rubeus]|uniref:Uncharacterized protein n=1 Tax=Erythrobacter rubeus TaxID=2760803 RepID=A0ABR8KPV3_9SPHN|nr:hypothetical protein [Erythrobacter rubeus]MBD2842695.1 hypothetical protein [Erythrobacter rubeus]
MSEFGAFRFPSVGGVAAPPSADAMEGMLIAWHELWWRTPGDGASPFAKDGPWHLAQREVGDIAGSYSVTLIETDAGKLLEVRKIDSPRPRPSLRTREVAVRDAVDAWLEALPEPIDRAVLVQASKWKYRGQDQVPWGKVKARLGYDRSARRLAGRYREALCKLVCRANGVPERHWRGLMAREAVLAV